MYTVKIKDFEGVGDVHLAVVDMRELNFKISREVASFGVILTVIGSEDQRLCGTWKYENSLYFENEPDASVVYSFWNALHSII